jgi:iron complex outermembrane receptor protein
VVVPYIFGNVLDGRSYGAEAAATYNVFRRWTLTGSYSWLHARSSFNQSHPQAESLMNIDAGSEHLFQLRSNLDLPHQFEFDTNVFFAGASSARVVGQYVRVDVRAAWRPADRWEFSVVGQNLLRPDHREFATFGQGIPELVRRSVYGKINWSF